MRTLTGMRRDPFPLQAVQLCAVVVSYGALTATTAAQPQWQDVIRNLRHPEADTRLAAVERLGRANYAAAVDPLVPLIRDPDDRVQAAAIDAELTFFLSDRISDRRILGVGGSKSRAQLAFEGGPLLRTAAAAPPSLADVLIAAVRDENPRVRFDAVHALGFIVEAPLPPDQLRAFSDELDHYDPVIRAATARVLGRLRQRDAGDRLLGAVDDSSQAVRQFAIEALGMVREDRALPRVRDLIARAGNRSVDGLALALARIGAPDDLAYFKVHLTDRSAGVRRAAAEGIGRIGDRASVGAIDQLATSDRAPAVRLAAAFALHRLGRRQSQEIATMLADDERATQAREYLFELGPEAVPGIHGALKVAVLSRHRADLVQALGYLGSSADLPVVQALLRDPDERVQRAANAAIIRLKRSH
jgi:HEAT repeat protein